MEHAEIESSERSWFLEGLGEVGQFAARLIRNFLRAALFGEGFSVVLAAVVFFATRGGPMWRAPVATIITLVAASVVAFTVAVNIAIVMSLAETVKAKGLAKRTLDALFAELLGVTSEKPEGDFEMTRSMHGMPIPEMRRKLEAAGHAMLAHPLATALPGFVRWLVRKAQQLLVWATIWVVVAYATAKSDRDRKVDLLALRASLTQVVDELVTQKITLGAIRFGLLLGLAVTLGAWGFVEALVRFTS